MKQECSDVSGAAGIVSETAELQATIYVTVSQVGI